MNSKMNNKMNNKMHSKMHSNYRSKGDLKYSKSDFITCLYGVLNKFCQVIKIIKNYSYAHY